MAMIGTSVSTLLFLLLALPAGALPQALGADGRPLRDVADVDRLLAGTAAELGTNCSLLLVRGGKVVYERSLGRARPAGPVRIASATKWLTAAVVLSIADEGRLGLDDRVSRYLPAFTGAAGVITVRQLLAHTSGLPMAHPALERRDLTLQEAVDAIAATPLVTAPGEWCAYGDVSIQVAGRVAEVASGVSESSGLAWKTLFESRLSTPLGMAATSCEGAAPTRNPHLSGGATSTMRDYAQFLVMLLNEGTGNGRRVLSASAVNELLRNQIGSSPLRFNPFQLFPDLHPGWREVRYGLGAWIEAMDGTTGRAQEASAPGIFGFIPWIDRDQNLAGVFLADAPLDKTLPVYLKLKALLRGQR